MTTHNRPLSPHLQIYRPQMTSILSILHRASGLILAVGALPVIWWFWAVMSGPEHYAVAHGFFNGLFGKSLLLAWSLCMFYHLCNGVRHLVWDMGFALEIQRAYLAGRIAIGAAVVLTAAAWLL